MEIANVVDTTQPQASDAMRAMRTRKEISGL